MTNPDHLDEVLIPVISFVIALVIGLFLYAYGPWHAPLVAFVPVTIVSILIIIWNAWPPKRLSNDRSAMTSLIPPSGPDR
jgi:membrane protein implicated in regulation of membrane protease activity